MAGSIAAGTKLGRYEIVKHLATGGMAELLLARAGGLEGFERHVVIKRIRADQEDDQAFVDMFLHEARLAGSLHHHNIVQVYDIGEENGKPYFAMEYVHGEDLRTLLRRLYERKEQLPIQHLVTIVAAVATGLHHAHEQRGPDRTPLDIVHRDVTPANILVGYDGNVKVVDFGIARATVRRAATQAGMLVGRAPYMAPEQCTGAAIDRRCDIFALGVVMYELATVRRLFKGANEFVTMGSIVKGTIPKPSTLRKDLPPQLDDLIMRMLARDPAARYQNAEQVFSALESMSLALGLRTSSTALAAYMKQLFGERPEPWLGGERTPPTGVNFDEGPGVVAAPSAAEANAIPKEVRTTKSSPIARAAETATATPTPVPASGSQATPRAVPATGSQATPASAPGLAIPRTKTPVPSLAKLTPGRPAPTPTVRPVSTPVAKAPSPAAKAPSPAAKGPSPAAKGPSPAAKGPSPAAKGPSPAAKAPGPAVRPTPNPAAKPAPAKPTPSPVSSEAPTQRAKPSELDEDDSTAVVVPALDDARPAASKPADDDLDNLSFEVSKPPVFEVSKPVVAAAVVPVVTKGVGAAVAPKLAKPAADDLPDDTIAQDAELDDATAVASAPPAASEAAPVPPGRRSDPTEVVTPLPAPAEVADDAKNKLDLLAALSDSATPAPAPARNKKLLLIGGVGGLAVLGAILAFVIGTSGGDATKSPSTRAHTVDVDKPVEPPSPEPTPAPEPTSVPEPTPVVEQAKPEVAEPTPEPTPQPVAEPTDEPAPTDEAKPEVAEPTTEPTPEPTPTDEAKPTPKPKPKLTATKPKAKPKLTTKPKAKPRTKPVKPVKPAQPGWDPNALFPKK